jgi:exo-beta-1,3-glucanase (GH17 family)
MGHTHRPPLIRNFVRVSLLGFVAGCFIAACSQPAPALPPTRTALPSSATALPSATVTPPAPTATPTLLAKLQPPSQLFSTCWVAYSPTNYDPNQGVQPSEASLRQDLQTLQASGFTGLVTYGADGALGASLPRLAQQMGFELIMGIWDPRSAVERDYAIQAAAYTSTVGYVVGNEGLDSRYDLATLKNAMDALRQATGKPVATTEQSGDYNNNQALLDLGDWIFPTVHPFFAGYLEPSGAVNWTKQQFDVFRSQTARPLLFKEVGLPTHGDGQNRLTEQSQADYYRLLRETKVGFVYFEAFDQPWKTDPSVESYWGLFQADRTPKEAVQYVCGNQPPPSATPTSGPRATVPPPTATKPVSKPGLTPAASPVAPSASVFYIYSDADVSTNHFVPSGYMGDTGDISVNEAWPTNPHSGSASIKVTYNPLGAGPNACNYKAPCKWAGVYWLNPPNNWGTQANAGIDLSGYMRLTFWARSEVGAHIEFGIGGVGGAHPDSLQPARSTGAIALTAQWQPYTINLANADLSYLIGGFFWSTSWSENGIGVDNRKIVEFYLDDIRLER